MGASSINSRHQNSDPQLPFCSARLCSFGEDLVSKRTLPSATNSPHNLPPLLSPATIDNANQELKWNSPCLLTTKWKMIPSSSLQLLKKSPSFSAKSLLSSISYQLGLNSCAQILEDCITLFKSPPLGYQIHSKIIVLGFANDSFLSTKLITFHSLCGDIPSTLAVFELFPTCNVYLINSMIRGYSSNGLCQKAINLFHMKRGEEASIPDSYTFSCVLKACASTLDLRQGKQLHQLAVECGFGADIFVFNSLIFMYGKCGSLEDGVHVFDAAEMAREMIRSGLKPDQVTIISILALCSTIDTVVREAHGFVLKNGMEALSSLHDSECHMGSAIWLRNLS
ncbi:Pentatricopeptide repeat-containing protein [Platanthera zijinensis]|uniref:Pentatricopeptide repeat-containing protein n=1 Tax=Platanthera zijinensis TaxID=2320716 RepID=A0AAP0AXF9_9ASPA